MGKGPQPEFELDAIYLAALLAVRRAREGGGRAMDEHLECVLVEMGIDRGTFNAFLASH